MFMPLVCFHVRRAQRNKVDCGSHQLEVKSTAVVMCGAVRERNFVPVKIATSPDKPEHPVRQPDGGVGIWILLWIAAIAERKQRRIAARQRTVVETEHRCNTFKRLARMAVFIVGSHCTWSACNQSDAYTRRCVSLHGKMASMTCRMPFASSRSSVIA